MTPLKKLRIKKGLTLEKLADKVGMHHSGLVRIEHGNRWPSKKNLAKIMQSLDNEISEAEILWPERFIN